MGTSNRFRVVTDVVCDDFMHSLRPLGSLASPSRVAAPRRVPWMVVEQRGVSLRLGDFTIGLCDLVTGLKSRCWMPVFATLAARGGAAKRRNAQWDSRDS